MIEGDDKKVIW